MIWTGCLLMASLGLSRQYPPAAAPPRAQLRRSSQPAGDALASLDKSSSMQLQHCPIVYLRLSRRICGHYPSILFGGRQAFFVTGIYHTFIEQGLNEHPLLPSTVLGPGNQLNSLSERLFTHLYLLRSYSMSGSFLDALHIFSLKSSQQA